MNMQKFSDALDTLGDARWHIEVIDMACRHNPDDDAKAFSAVIATILQKIEAARSDLEDLFDEARVAPEVTRHVA